MVMFLFKDSKTKCDLTIQRVLDYQSIVVIEVESLVDRRTECTASEHGLNGLVLSAGLDKLDLQRKDYFARLRQVKKICSEHNIEIVPLIFSAG